MLVKRWLKANFISAKVRFKLRIAPTHTKCADVRYFLALNQTWIVNRIQTQHEVDLKIAYSILFTVILVLNAILVRVICFRRSLRKHSSILVGSLCLANILFCFTYILPAKIVIIGNSIHPFTNIYCQLLYNVIQFAFVCCMNFHICSIGLQKFIAITSPFWYNQLSIYKSLMFISILLICWILPILVAFFPLIIGWWRVCPYFCLISEIEENREIGLQAWHIFWAFLMFLLPTIITIIFYIRILLVARNHAIRMRSENQINSVSTYSFFGMKVVKTVVVVVGVYLILQTPYNIYQVVNVIDISRKFSVPQAREWLFYLASCNSAASPIIYGFFDKTLRNEVSSLFWRCNR